MVTDILSEKEIVNKAIQNYKQSELHGQLGVVGGSPLHEMDVPFGNSESIIFLTLI